MKEITVVIPNYNGIKFIEECMESLLAQQTEELPFDVIVVDNGSTDGSLEWLLEHFGGENSSSYASERASAPASDASALSADGAAKPTPSNVTLLPLNENTGFCHAVNVGIQQAKTPYILLLNNDTKVRPGFVKNLYDAIASRPKVFSVSAKMLMWDRPDLLDDAGDNYCALGWAYARGKGKPSSGYNNPVKIFASCGGAAIYRSSVFEEIGLFDEAHFAYLEDLDMGYRAQIHGYDNFYEPSAEVIHYGSASTGSRYNEFKTIQAAQNSVYVVLKNMPLLQWIWNLPLLVPGCFIKFLFFCRKKMGGLYLKGLARGLKLGFSRVGKKRKVPFKVGHLGRYFAIQWQLYVNLFKFLKKS